LLAPTGGATQAQAGSAQVPLARLVGQTVMVAIDGTSADADLLARVRRGEVGGVILFGNNITSLAGLRSLIATLQAAAKAGGNPPLLVATDQEGGIVKRLPDGPPTLSASELGARGSAAFAAAQGKATGRYLGALGIDVDLAPVLDVPDRATSFLGSRTFAGAPGTVAKVGVAFADGVQAARVAATAKHFPGLGTARANTDLQPVTVASTRADLMRRIEPFRAAVDAGTKLVMVSNAAYPALDPSGLPACLSPAIVNGLLRGRLGFGGVVITDAISAPGPAHYPDAPTRALAAGVDIVLFAVGEDGSSAGYRALVTAAERGELRRATLQRAYDRVLALKRWLGGA
jgi:beta-N-acetylhexosaminidase